MATSPTNQTSPLKLSSEEENLIIYLREHCNSDFNVLVEKYTTNGVCEFESTAMFSKFKTFVNNAYVKYMPEYSKEYQENSQAVHDKLKSFEIGQLIKNIDLDETAKSEIVIRLFLISQLLW